ncbi:unnamed protein product [Urochloa humidicola]
MAIPTSTSLGVLGSLLRKLNDQMHQPLKSYLEKIHGYLDELSRLEEPTLKQRTWMKEVGELSYDMEDHFDRKLMSAEELVHEFSAHLEEAIERYKRYNLHASPVQRRYLPVSCKLTKYAEVADPFPAKLVDDLVHLVKDKQELLKVVAIVGPGGVGKTTLARMVYQSVGGDFDCRAFVRVTRKPDMKRLLRDILSQVRSHQPADACGVQELIDLIKEHLRHKRYLIVMDDMCATSLWHSIRRAIPEGSSGSRIIITGHIEEVALTCCGYNPKHIFKINYLSMESSRVLFSTVAFGSECSCPNQVNDIIEKCGGLPLIIVNIASLLSSFVERHQDAIPMVEQWNHINYSLRSNLRVNFTPEVTKQALNLCYNNLPHHLKTCLLYLAIYPEDYTVLKDDLVKLWVTEGFVITAVGEQEQAMDEAGKYFDELVQRRMMQPVDISDNNEVLSCTLHSMVLDLIANKSVEDNFIVVLDKYQGLIGLPEKVRRLSLHFGNARHANAPEFISLSQVRLLAFFGFYKCMPPIEKFELVRVLVLQIWGDNCGTIVDLSGISKLHHLRHLKIVCDTIIDLPTQIHQLQYLMTIEIDAAISVVPSDIVDLPGLLHLLLPIEADMPDRIGDMPSLCTLGYFDLSKYSKDMVHSLGQLTNLQHLHLACSSATSIHLESNFNALGSILESLGKLKSVTVVPRFLYKRSLVPGHSALTMTWEDFSRPPPFLQNLELSPRICTFSSLPNWTRQLSKLSTLKIAVHKLEKIDVGVLEELSTLTILSLHVKNAPAERISFLKGKFPALKFFKFICSVPWLEFEEGTMPNLQKLHLGFNAHGAAAGGHTPVGMRHLLSLQLVRGVIGCFQAEQSDRNAAESALRNTASVHGRKRPEVNIRWVDWNFYPVYDKTSMHSVDNGILSSPELKGVTSNLEKSEPRWIVRETKFQQSEMSDWTIAIPVVHEELYADRREVCSVASIPDSSVKECTNQAQQIIQAPALRVLRKEFTELLEKMQQIHAFLVAGMRIEVYSTVIWLSHVKDAMSEADAIIDSIKSEGAQESHASSPSPTSLIACIPVQFLSCVHSVQKRPKINAKIRKLQQRVKTLANAEPIVKSSPWNRNISHLLEPNLVGEEIINASGKLADWVVAHKGKGVHKHAIVGGGGVGKTALAQKVYNHQKVRGIFSKKAWICVSREYSDSTLLKELLKNIGVPQEKELRKEELRSKLSEAVKGKSLFLVLDNVCTSQVWTGLLQTPLDAAATAIILVTTRNTEVAQAIGVQNNSTYQVKLMTREDGWELFWKSMHINEEEEVKNLKEIGMQIVDKCDGLPLAIKAVAGVLATKDKTKKQWKKILRNSAWSPSEASTELHGAFYLSYEDLQPYLKKCFLYCALFPERWTLNRDDLVRFWVAEGFVEDKENQLLEDSAEEYYYELIYRNLLEPEPIHFGHQWCKVHHLSRQLALLLLKEEFFSGDPESLDPKTLSKLRYISVFTGKNLVRFPAMGTGLEGVRTLIFNCENSTSIESTVFQQFHHVKVLDLTGLSVGNLTDYIGNLNHLRLLDLDGTDVSRIPDSIGSLRSLEILNLQRCDSLHSLPSAITKLCNLRRLGLGGTSIDEVPEGIGNLVFLSDLEGFPIGTGRDNNRMQDGWKLEELASLVQLRRLDVVKLGKALPCGTSSFLENKEHLKFIVLRCTEQATDGPYSDEGVKNIETIFEQLVPPNNLEDLAIDRFFGRCYPTWLGTHLPSVKHLTLANCTSCEQLPPVGQLPNLQYLRIVGATAVTRIGPEFIGRGVGNPNSSQAVAFPVLELLVMRDMTSWEKWSFVEEEEIQHESTPGYKEMALQLLPRLKELQLVNCPKISYLPQHLAKASSLKLLQLRGASSLKVLGDLPCLSDSLVLATCSNLETISNLPVVRVIRLQKCLNLRSVENLDNLHQMWLTEDMKEASSQWLPQLQEQNRLHYGREFDVYTWR